MRCADTTAKYLPLDIELHDMIESPGRLLTVPDGWCGFHAENCEEHPGRALCKKRSVSKKSRSAENGLVKDIRCVDRVRILVVLCRLRRIAMFTNS
jgi:hypothetical protein